MRDPVDALAYAAGLPQGTAAAIMASATENARLDRERDDREKQRAVAARSRMNRAQRRAADRSARVSTS